MDIDPDITKQFLTFIHPGGPWPCVGIDKDRPEGAKGKVDPAILPQDDQGFFKALAKWKNEDRNCYFHVAILTPGFDGKASKTDCVKTFFIHVDLDLRAGEDRTEGLARLKLKAEGDDWPDDIPLPSAVLFSGNGYQFFWKLSEAVALNEPKNIELYNKELTNRLGGDSGTWNCDRLMRLPQTINCPDKSKRKKGREKVLATLVFIDESRVYDLSEFKKFEDFTAAASIGTEYAIGDHPKVRGLGILNDYRVNDRVKSIIKFGKYGPPKEKDDSPSAWCYDVVCNLIRSHVPDALIYAIITDETNKVSKTIKEHGGHKYALKQIADAKKQVSKDTIVLFSGAPMVNARLFLQTLNPTLKRIGKEWLAQEGTAYNEIEHATLQSRAYRFMEKAARPGKVKLPRINVKDDDATKAAKDERAGMQSEPDFLPFNPDNKDVTEMIKAVEAITHVKEDHTRKPPYWLDGRADYPAKDILAMQNGLLYLPTGELLTSTPAFYTRNAADFDYDPKAPEPVAWFKFLDDLFPGRPDDRRLLQEMLGYILTSDTSQQKILFLKGPRRAGKGIIYKIMTLLIGRQNVVGPKLKDLGRNFGKAMMIDKPLAVIADLRLDRNVSTNEIVEVLLNISGEDLVACDRKFKGHWQGILPTTLLLISNLDLKLNDPAGALALRMLPIILTESFAGREDVNLLDKLEAERSGILNWAIEGWRRLRENGRFTESASVDEERRTIHANSDPISGFLHTHYNITGLATDVVGKDELFQTYLDWIRDQREDDLQPLENSRFCGQVIVTGAGKIKVTRPRSRTGQGGRVQVFTGIAPLGKDDLFDRKERLSGAGCPEGEGSDNG